MLKGKQAMLLSAIIDKMDIKITDPKATKEEVGADLMMQIIRRAHRAQEEIFELVSEYKGVSIEEAKNVDFIALLSEIFNQAGVKDFFTSIVR